MLQHFIRVVHSIVSGNTLPEYVTSVTGAGSTAGTVTVDLSGLGLENGDLLIVFVKSDNAGTSVPTCSAINDIRADDSPCYYLGFENIGASPPSSVQVTTIGAYWVYAAMRFRNCDYYTDSFASGTSGMPNPGSLIVNSVDSLIVVIGSLDDDLVTSTPPTNYTEMIDRTHGSSGSGGSLFVAYKVAGETGSAVDPPAFTGSGTDDWQAFALQLYPV